MPQSRGAVVLAVAFALIGAACTGIGATALAATTGRSLGASPFPTQIPSPLPSALDPTPAPIDTITIVSAGIAPAQGGVQLSVTADSTSVLASMTVHLLDTTMNTDALDLVMNPPAEGPAPGESTWTSDVITTATLPLGTYNATVDATDQGGTTVTQLAAPPPPIAFQHVPTITPNPVNLVISYDNQHPTISGTVTELTPGAASAMPYANQPVFVADASLPGGGASVVTDANGAYSYTFAAPGPSETFTVEVLPTPAVAAASAAPVSFSVVTDPVTMTASLSAKTITYGAKVTVSGTVTYEPGSAFVPLHGLAVQVFYNRAGGTLVATALTDPNGHFSATLPKEAATVHWVLQAGGPYLTTATVTLPMKVNLPTVISGFQATLSNLWRISYRGCIALPAGVPGFVPSLAGLTVQYAAGANGPWKTLGTVPKQKSVLCGNGGQTFSGTLTAKLNYAYYRAVYAGGTNTAGTGFLASVSGKALAWKYEDRITSFSVSPRSVPKGGKLTVAGTLQYFLSGSWRAYAKQTVYVILRPKGSTTWYYIVAVSTNSVGRFSATFKDPVTATWSAEYFGNSTHLATLAPNVAVTVT